MFPRNVNWRLCVWDIEFTADSHDLSLCLSQDLIHDLKSELTGNFEKLALNMLMKPAYFDAAELREAIKVWKAGVVLWSKTTLSS